MDIAAVSALIGPPPPEPEPVNWDVVAAEVGFLPPREYREYVSAYGLGSLGKFLWIAVPVSTVPRFSLAGRLQRGREMRAALGDEGVPPFDPATMLMFGDTVNGDSCFWLRESDDPDLWPILVESEDGELRSWQPRARAKTW